jgi:integrase
MGYDSWIPRQRAYLKAIRSYYAPKTLVTMERGFKTIHKAFLELRKEGKVSTTDPKKLTRDDIAAFMEWMRNRRTRHSISLAHGTQANYLDYLNGFLRFENNGVIDQMRKLHYVRFPQKVSVDVRVLSESRVEEIRSKLRTMQGYEGAVARFMVAMYAYSGLRRSELRRARLEDLNIDTRTIVMAHPKGEGSWAVVAPAWILQPAREPVVEFLAARNRYLADAGIKSCDALVPKVTDGVADYWTDGMWGKVKAKAEEWSGIRFRIQTLRATFGQMCIDWGGRPDAVSRALRHKTTRTTELYYARIRPDHAFRLLDQAYDSAHRATRSVPDAAN